MKKYWIILLSLLIFFGLAGAILQSSLAQSMTRRFLENALQESGCKIEIESIEGTFPVSMRLKKVRISSDFLDVSMDSLETDLSLLGFLKKELIFTKIEAQGVGWSQKQRGENLPARIGQGLPVALQVKRFDLIDVLIPGYGVADFKGSMRIGKHNRKFFLDISTAKACCHGVAARVLLDIAPGGIVRLKGYASAPKLMSIPLPFSGEAKGAVRFAARGTVGGGLSGKANASGTIQHVALHPLLDDALNGNWTGSAKFRGRIGGDWNISSLQISHPSASMKGSIALGSRGQLHRAKAIVHIGELESNIEAAERESGGYRIDAKGQGWSAEADFAEPASIPHFAIQAGSIKYSGALSFHQKTLIGLTELSIENLHELPCGLYGSLQAKLDWTEVDASKQGLRIVGEGANIYWKDLFAQNITFQANLSNPFHQMQGQLDLAGKQVQWRELLLDSVTAQTTCGKELTFSPQAGSFSPDQEGTSGAFAISALGKWKHPIQLQIDGNWLYRSSQFLCSLQSMSGAFFNHPLFLSQAAYFEWSPGQLRLTDLILSLEDGLLKLRVEQEQERTDIDLSLKHFPIDALSLNPLEIGITGRTDCTLAIKESGTALRGDLTASIQGMKAASSGEESPLSASGQIRGHFDKSRLDLDGALQVGESQIPLLQLDLSLPIDLNIRSLQAAILYDKPVQGRLAYHGRVEDILDFFDLGVHRIEGTGSCDFTLSRSLQAPYLEGDFQFTNGYYENYLTGTQLVEIQAEGRAHRDQLILNSLTALDQRKQGRLTASGTIDLLLAKQLPFRFDIDINGLEAVQIDLVSAEMEGKIEVAGNMQKALASGVVTVTNSDFHIPSHIARPLPNLIVIYKNPSKPIEYPALPAKAPFPLFLDLAVKAPKGIFIEGRGLQSEWKGDFHVTGSYIEVAAEGTLELIKGEILFSGRSFKLADGALTFHGKDRAMPSLNLSGSMEIKDVEITARLKGPLNNPQITFQSTPPLPLSTIMAYLLFGQELSEINSFQALQLANSLAAFAGAGPDVLENARKSLGIDRLQVVSIPGGSDDLRETLALQVGKYVSEGVLVSFTQGSEEASSNISIEVEMKHGLFFQLESDQRQEQGKFTLKWHHNY